MGKVVKEERIMGVHVTLHGFVEVFLVRVLDAANNDVAC
jgi:hypothetical protein